MAEELLKSEGFSDVQYVDVGNDIYPAFMSGKVDISMAFVAPFIVQLDANVPIVLLGGVHVGCFELFGMAGINAVHDLKGKTVAVPSLGSAHHGFIASMVAHVGLDPSRDINFVTHPTSESARLLAEAKVDALIGFPPVPQELREKKIGHVIVNSGLDRPWSQYFCCVVAASQEFVRKRPVATKRALRAIMKATHFCVFRARACRPHRGGPRLSLRLRSADNERDSLRKMARVRSRGCRALLCASTARSRNDQVDPQQASSPQGTDWRFFNELKRELKG